MDKTLLPIRIAFVLICAGAGWLLSVTTLAGDEHRLLPIVIGCAIGALVVLPLVTHGVTAISRLQVWTQGLWLLLLALLLIWCLPLPLRDLLMPDEGRYAQIPQAMLASGDWLTPRLNDLKYFEKPPLVYWSVAAGMTVLGSSEAAVRMTGAVFALGGVLLTYAAGRRLFNRAAGLVAAVVLGSSLLDRKSVV